MTEANNVRHTGRVTLPHTELNKTGHVLKKVEDTGIGELTPKKEVKTSTLTPVVTKEEEQAAAKKAEKLKGKAEKGDKVTSKGNKVTVKKADGTKVVYTVDANGKTVEKTTVDGDKKTTVVYNKDGSKTKTVKENGKKTVVEFDKNNNRTSKTIVEGKGDDKVTTLVGYDSSGNRISKTTEGFVSGNQVRVDKTFDPTSQKVTSKTVKTTTESGVIEQKTDYEYDKDGNLTQRTTQNGDKTVSTAFQNYSVDENGNTTRDVVITTKEGDKESAVYKKQVLSPDGDILQSEWFLDADHTEKTKDVEYSYNADGTKDEVLIKNYKDGAVTKETKRSNYRKENGVTLYDVEISTYSTESDGNLVRSTTKQTHKKYFDGTILRGDILSALTEIILPKKSAPIADETGGEEDADDVFDKETVE